MKKPDKKRKSLTVRLPAEIAAKLLKEAEDISLSCSALIRVIVTKHVNTNKKEELARREYGTSDR